MANFDNTTFYSAPWGEPTKIVAEYNGQTFDIREGWGCREGWTSNHVALQFEPSEEQSSQMLEVSRREMRETETEEDIKGIFAAIDKATA